LDVLDSFCGRKNARLGVNGNPGYSWKQEARGVGVATRFVVEWKGQRLYWKKCLGTGGKEGAGTGKGRKVRLDWGGRERLGGPNGE